MDREQAATRRVATVLLVVEALTVVSPVLALDAFVAGGQLLGKGLRWGVPDAAGQGLVYASSLVVVFMLALAADGVLRGSRGVAALLLQPVVLGYAWIPFFRPMGTLSAWDAGRWLTAALVVVCTAVCAAVALAGPAAGGGRRWTWWLGLVGALVVLALAGARSSALPLTPAMWILPDGEVASAGPRTARPRGPVPAQNPAMAANPWNSIHNDSWATDSYRIPGPAAPLSAATDSLFTGGDCATITFDSRGRLVTLCPSLLQVSAYVVDPGTMQVLARRRVDRRMPSLTDFSGGGYFVLDGQDRMVFPTSDGRIRVLAITGDPVQFVDESSWPVTDALRPGEGVTSVLPDWRGRLWFVGGQGTVGLLDPRNGSVRTVQFPGESIENSFAVSDNGVFVVSGGGLYRLWAKADGQPYAEWRADYDSGERRKPGQTSQASGTTPTVFDGGRLVAITDNADPRMHVEVFRTRDGRRICSVPVFAAGSSATDNSLIAAGDLLIVENNYGYFPAVTSAVNGRTTAPGMAAIRVAADRCAPAWENSELTAPSVVAKASTADGLVYTYTKPASHWSLDGWYFTGVDLDTGVVAWTRLAGAGTAYNNHYAGMAIGPDGDLFVGTTVGIVVLRGGA